jgi:hypothetical protein
MGLAFHAVLPLILMTPLESLAQVNATTENRSFAWAWQNQAGAFRCLIAQPLDSEYPDQCAMHTAPLWLCLFLIGFVGYFFLSNVLFEKTSAFWTILLQTIVAPISAVAFNFPQIVGDSQYSPFTIYSGASFFVILVGVIFRGSPQKEEKVTHQHTDDEVSYEKVPLVEFTESLADETHDLSDFDGDLSLSH